MIDELPVIVLPIKEINYMPTLLEQAKAYEIRKSIPNDVTDEQIELALGWLRGEITLAQMSKALKSNSQGSNAYQRAAMYLREAFLKGQLIIK